jgi:hypothetical protein
MTSSLLVFLFDSPSVVLFHDVDNHKNNETRKYPKRHTETPSIFLGESFVKLRKAKGPLARASYQNPLC